MLIRITLFSATVLILPCSPGLTHSAIGQQPDLLEADDVALVANEVRIAAHRGGYETDKTDDAPENSVANIRVCQDKGYELYETDIQRTKDGHFVIIHDPTIDRETTGSGSASEMNLKELKALFKKFRDGSKSQHRVATLEEFLVEGKGRVVFKADLKPGVNRYFKEIMAIVKRHQVMNGIIFRVPYRDADLLDALRKDGVVFEGNLLMFMVSNKNQVDDIRQRFDPTTIQVNLRKDDPTDARTIELIRYANRKGFVVETHAEGTEDDWRVLIGAGVRIFHTSKPAKMKSFLQQMDRPFPQPVPSPKAPAIELSRNEQGFLVRSEKSHEEAAARVRDYLQTQYLPKVREHYPDQDVTSIKLAGRPSVDGLDVHENLVYARWGQRAMVLDLYLPKRADKERLPLVIFIHGGGWVRGSHRGYRPAAIEFAKRGFATATVEYRVAGEAMFPAAIYDVKAAIRWLRAHAGEFHLDPKRFGITGGSAGGNIAVLTAVTFGDFRFEGPANHLDQSSEIQCVLSLYGAMSWTARSWTDSKPGSHLMNETLPDFHIAGGSHLPPILFLNEWDRRKDRRWGADTMEIIKKVGKDDRAELTLINAPHGFIYFSPHQAIALDHLERFFGKHLSEKAR